MTRRVVTSPSLVVAAAVALSACQTTPAPSTPAGRKGDGVGQVHPDYPTAPAPDPRTTGRWMVYAVGQDDTRTFVICWRDSDPATFREVKVSEHDYQHYVRNVDTGSIPCPAPFPTLPR